MKENDNFKIPSIVRQKGLIDESLKMYLESKVLSYIKEMKEKTYSGTRFGILLGKYEMVEEEKCLIISGMIKCNCKNEEGLDDYFLKQLKGFTKVQIEKNFPNSIVVGLVVVDKAIDEDMTNKLKHVFHKYFKGDGNLLFLQGKYNEELFCIVEDKLISMKGYFVNYEKNEEMQKYIDENPIEMMFDEDKKNKKEDNISNEKIISMNIKKDNKENKMCIEKVENMKVGRMPVATVLLFFLTVIIGVGLLENINDTNELKASFSNIDVDKYMEIQKELGDLSNVAEVVEPEINEETKISTMGNITEPLETFKDNEIESEITDVDQTSAVTTATENMEIVDAFAKNFDEYTVEKGDNLKQISTKFYGSDSKVDEIKNLNSIENENYIRVGSVLKLPK